MQESALASLVPANSAESVHAYAVMPISRCLHAVVNGLHGIAPIAETAGPSSRLAKPSQKTTWTIHQERASLVLHVQQLYSTQHYKAMHAGATKVAVSPCMTKHQCKLPGSTFPAMQSSGISQLWSIALTSN